MTKDTNLNQVIFNKMSLAKYNELKEAGQLNENEFYITPDTNDTNNIGLEIGDIILTPFGIDESENKRRYLNGQVILQDQYPQFTTKLKSWKATRAGLFTTEENWQTIKTNSKLGQCGKFVIDDTAGTIRLPLVKNINGMTDLRYCGVLRYETLPNITAGDTSNSQNTLCSPASAAIGRYGAADILGDADNASRFQIGGLAGTLKRTIFDASLSSSTYRNNAPVQQEAIQYPYAIVVNTGVEEAERPINNYQVNNVYSYGMSQYYKGTMNNNSWLKSAGQWNDGTVYTGMYQWLVEQMNAGVSGFVASSATYTDYDFVINTTDQTFRLPLKNGQEGVFADGVKGNGMTLGLTDGTKNLGLVSLGQQWSASYQNSTYGSSVGTSAPTGEAYISNKTIGITADSSKSGMVVDKTVPTGWNLYYYIGDTLQNAQLINVARIEEKLTDVSAASRGYVVDSYSDDSGNWYRVYSDGWVEQGGILQQKGQLTVNLLKPMKDIKYGLFLSSGDNTGGTSGYAGNFYADNTQYWSKTVSSFKCTCSLGASPAFGKSWMVIGKGAN